MLLDRGLGAAGVAIDAAAVKGIARLPFAQLKSAFPVLKNPANNHRAVQLSAEEFHYAFTNSMSEEDSLRVYERYAVPGPGRILFQGAFANFNPHAATHVDFANDDRAPLLLIAGELDHTVPRSSITPPSSTTANPKRSPTTSSSRAARTSSSARRVGRRSPTTRSTGPRASWRRTRRADAVADHAHRRRR